MRFASLFTLLVVAATVHATTIIVIAQGGQIFIGADGLRSGKDTKAGTALSEQVCKVNQHGAVLVAHYGGYWVLLADRKSGQLTTVFDSGDIENEADLRSGSLLDKAASLKSVADAAYFKAVGNMPAGLTDAARREFQGQLSSVAFIIAGIAPDGTPKAIVLHYWTDFSQLLPTPQEKTMKVPDDSDGYVLGYRDGIPTSSIDQFGEDVGRSILENLERQSQLHPTEVGPPFTVARVSKNGISFDTRGACGTPKP